MEYQARSSPTLELVTCLPVEYVRSVGSDDCFSGYAVVWHDPKDKGTEYRRSLQTIEQIDSHAFDDVLLSGDNIQALYNHSFDHVLGSTSTRTLFLQRDNKGLRYTIPFDAEDPDHVKVAAKIRKGIVQGSSFRASWDETIRKQGNYYVARIEKIRRCREVSIVNNPAYKATSSGMRDEFRRFAETYERIMRDEHR